MLRLGWRIRQLRGILAVSSGISVLIIAIGATGLFQPLEWFVFDRLLRFRASDGSDPRFLIVTIDENDLQALKEWPISDGNMARVLQQIQIHRPRVIGIDIYRDLPVGNGQTELNDAFQTIPNVIGVEKLIGKHSVPPAPELGRQGKVGLADLVPDQDGRIRRGLLAIKCNKEQQLCNDNEHQQIKYGLGTKLALIYLEQQQIYPEVSEKGHLKLGKAVFRRFSTRDGGYATADDSSTQILINYPAGETFFDTVTISQVLKGEVAAHQIQDRIILIGATAVSLNDLIYTPMSLEERLPGVFIHAHIASQLIGSALDGRTILHGASPWVKYLWIVLATNLGVVIVHGLIHQGGVYRQKNLFSLVLVMPCVWAGVTGVVYGFFQSGLWLPLAAPLLSISMASVLLLLLQNQQLHGLASLDGLTSIANRRSFDNYLQNCIYHQEKLALVLCDVDYFKRYNDTYGHQAGDKCLQSIAKALEQGVRHSDFVARYGGEEFVIVLPNTEISMVYTVLERIQNQITKLEIAHKASDVSDHVTLSFGVVTVGSLKGMSAISAKAVIEWADHALYQAKELGRNQISATIFPHDVLL
ncbi:CHASE2 domain-containing protein [Leptothoe sp. PORK10 BA2]|uniref:CHASE2 domain-containing protein n=1 Tax=Leptothoe sp. PORK10 BA2 TaxID=3110254 RepID=UPI002B20EEEC|nr:CHASE2 domain-containing protein [Leptothoe sp. PORK10 BA2]MEA5466754.1 CHASE2 domain-containing protein [Leptothoe sp. PORK10 BA2]